MEGAPDVPDDLVEVTVDDDNAEPPELGEELEEEFLHELEQSLPEGGVIEEGGGRAEPAVEVDDLVVGVDVLALADVPQPGRHHGPQHPDGRRRQGRLIVAGQGCTVAGH